jgi:hypothetical protein
MYVPTYIYTRRHNFGKLAASYMPQTLQGRCATHSTLACLQYYSCEHRARSVALLRPLSCLHCINRRWLSQHRAWLPAGSCGASIQPACRMAIQLCALARLDHWRSGSTYGGPHTHHPVLDGVEGASSEVVEGVPGDHCHHILASWHVRPLPARSQHLQWR